MLLQDVCSGPKGLALHCCSVNLERWLDFSDPASCKMQGLDLQSHFENLMTIIILWKYKRVCHLRQTNYQ